MRSDYALYGVAVIFFIITAIVSISTLELREVWIVSTAIAGLFFAGLGYTQRPKAKAVTTEVPQPTQTVPTAVVEVEEKKAEAIVETTPGIELTQVKGIGAKRAEQLKALGLNSVEDLAKASAKELAEKLKISQKITAKWIENAKKLTEKA
ncbi:MAG: helix-hairpin-helix domain-containing protein [Candidatus Bathycorpusculaceae bacterium]